MQSPALQGRLLSTGLAGEVPVNIILILGTRWPIASVSLDSHIGHGDMGPENCGGRHSGPCSQEPAAPVEDPS